MANGLNGNYSDVDIGITCGSLTTTAIRNAVSWLSVNNGCDIYKDNNNKDMKIGKREMFKIVLRETVITDYTHELLAENKEEALEKIKNEMCARSSNVVSVEVTEVE